MSGDIIEDRQPDIIFQGNDIRVTKLDGSLPIGIVTFNAYTEDKRPDVPSAFEKGFAEKYFWRHGFSEYHIITNKNDWFQSDEMDEAIKYISLERDRKKEKLTLYGSSMGGFAAINFSNKLNAGFVVLAPQYSILPDDVSGDTRWIYESTKVNFKNNYIKQGDCLESTGYLFYDSLMEDNVHAQKIAERTKVQLIDLKYGDHLIGDVINDIYGLVRVVEEVALGKFTISQFYSEFELKKDESIAYKLKKAYYSAKHGEITINEFDNIEVSDRILNNLGLCLKYLETAIMLKHNVRECAYTILSKENEDFIDRYILVLEILINYRKYDLADELLGIGEKKQITNARLFYNASVIKCNIGELDTAIEYIERAIDEEKLTGYYNYREELISLKGKCAIVEDNHIEDINVPAFSENNVPIVIATNDYYAPYISTLLLSIKKHSSANNNYDILVLSHDIKEENKKILQDTLKDKENFSLRFTDPGSLLDGYDLYTRGHFSVETYYRLVLPEMLADYDKILYIDVDMIAVADLAELYHTDVEGYLLAAAYDPDTAGLYNGFQPDKKAYMDKEMALENPYHYFQAGTLVMNLKEFRKTFTTKQILDVAASKEWQLLDQDILNVLCEHRVKILDMSWNVMYDYAGVRIKEIIRLAPEWLYLEYMEARKHPKIIHYAGPEKPWLFPEGDFASVYWEYAKQTPYYEMMLYRMSCYAANKEIHVQGVSKKAVRQSMSPIYRTIRCFFVYGPAHTFREIKKALGITK